MEAGTASTREVTMSGWPFVFKPHVLLRPSTVTIYAGPQRHPFHFHETVLCTLSTHFNAIITAESAKNEDVSIELPTVEVETMSAFEPLLNSRVVPGFKPSELSRAFWDPTGNNPTWLELPVKTFVFADTVGCAHVQGLVLHSLASIFHPSAARPSGIVQPGAAQLAWTHLQPGSKLRQLLLDVFTVQEHAHSADCPPLDQYPAKFMASCFRVGAFVMDNDAVRLEVPWFKYFARGNVPKLQPCRVLKSKDADIEGHYVSQGGAQLLLLEEDL